MLHNGYETVGTDGRINLYSDSILSCSPELLNFEVLFEPFEEQFYLPTILVEVGNLLCGQFHCIGKEHEHSVLLFIMESDESQTLGITFLTAINGQFDFCVCEYSLGLAGVST